MSTYYYAVCDTHKIKLCVWIRPALGRVPHASRQIEEHPDLFQNMLSEHCACGMSIIDEHDERFYNYQCIDEDIDEKAS